MTDEMYIEEKVGKRNPFRVPEGYFEQFTAQMMEQIPETAPKQKPRAKSIWLRPVFYAAASVCALLISATVWLALPSEQPSASPMQAQTVQQDESDTYLDEAADYMMLDNHEIYSLLADN
jgi:hypothetical protein